MSRIRKYTLVIIDMQPAFKAAKNNRKLIKNISCEIEKAKSLNNHIVFVKYYRYGSVTASLRRAIADYNNVSALVKHYPDGGKKLFHHLKSIGLTHLKVCGVETNVCVRQTVFSLARLYPKNFRIEILSDCCAALTNESHEYGIQIFQNKPNTSIAVVGV